MEWEFDCQECGRHIIRFIPPPLDSAPVCAECLYLPGWFNDPELRSRLDPEMKPPPLP